MQEKKIYQPPAYRFSNLDPIISDYSTICLYLSRLQMIDCYSFYDT